jgi:hypothetical protein
MVSNKICVKDASLIPFLGDAQEAVEKWVLPLAPQRVGNEEL